MSRGRLNHQPCSNPVRRPRLPAPRSEALGRLLRWSREDSLRVSSVWLKFQQRQTADFRFSFLPYRCRCEFHVLSHGPKFFPLFKRETSCDGPQARSNRSNAHITCPKPPRLHGRPSEKEGRETKNSKPPKRNSYSPSLWGEPQQAMEAPPLPRSSGRISSLGSKETYQEAQAILGWHPQKALVLW